MYPYCKIWIYNYPNPNIIHISYFILIFHIHISYPYHLSIWFHMLPYWAYHFFLVTWLLRDRLIWNVVDFLYNVVDCFKTGYDNHLVTWWVPGSTSGQTVIPHWHPIDDLHVTSRLVDSSRQLLKQVTFWRTKTVNFWRMLTLCLKISGCFFDFLISIVKKIQVLAFHGGFLKEKGYVFWFVSLALLYLIGANHHHSFWSFH